MDQRDGNNMALAFCEGFHEGYIKGQLDRIGTELMEEFGNDTDGKTCVGGSCAGNNGFLHTGTDGI